jgi:hypothetical protein
MSPTYSSRTARRLRAGVFVHRNPGAINFIGSSVAHNLIERRVGRRSDESDAELNCPQSKDGMKSETRWVHRLS